MTRVLLTDLLLLPLLFASLLTISGCADEETKGSIAGTVTDATSSQPVGGVNVVLTPGGSSVVTGSDGKFNFNELEQGDYSVQLTKQGYQTETRSASVFAGETRQLDVTLAPNTPALSVDVNSLDFGSNLTSLPIEIRNTGAGELNWSVTEDIPWASVNPISGSTTTQVSSVNVAIDRSVLSQGDYSNTVVITSNGGNATVTLTVNVPNPDAPVVTGNAPLNISQATAEVSGNIMSMGGGQVIEHGHCWSTSPNPTISDQRTTLGPASALGPFLSVLTGLSGSTTYYVRAYASNSYGTAYSLSFTFTTTSTPTIPILITNAATNIGGSEATVGGTLADMGSSGISQHGHCWSTQPNPSIADTRTSLGQLAAPGPFSSGISGLTPNTTYYVRAYATNATGTGYGNEVSFQSGATVVTSGLVAYYKFDGQNGNDELGNYNCFTQGTSPPQFSSDSPSGSGLSALFDGNGYFVNANNPLLNNTSYTFSAWVKTTSGGFIFNQNIGSTKTALGISSNKIGIRYYGNNNLLTYFSSDITNQLLDGSWHLLTVSFNGGTAKMFIDGVLLESIGTANQQHSAQMLVGNGFIGRIDNLRIYNRELTQQEISQLFNAVQ